MANALLEQDELLKAGPEEIGQINPEDAWMWETRPERNMGAKSSRVATRIVVAIGEHVERRQLGQVFISDCGYLLPLPALKKVRFPDASFVAQNRLPEGHVPDGNMSLAPDLAVEVVSPNDLAYEVEEKRDHYLRAGVRLVWVVYPNTRIVFVHRPGQVSMLGENDTLSGEDVLADFSCPIGRFFEGL